MKVCQFLNKKTICFLFFLMMCIIISKIFLISPSHSYAGLKIASLINSLTTRLTMNTFRESLLLVKRLLISAELFWLCVLYIIWMSIKMPRRLMVLLQINSSF
jgi:hypothetical protein